MPAGTAPEHQQAAPDTSDSNPPRRLARGQKEKHSKRSRGGTRPYSRRAGTGERSPITPTTGVERGHRHPSPSTGSGRGNQAQLQIKSAERRKPTPILGKNYSGTSPSPPPAGIAAGGAQDWAGSRGALLWLL
jgi:hypothetical protein